MKKLRVIALLLIFVSILNHPAALAVDSSTGERLNLYGKTMLVLGDSYTAGFGLRDGRHGWTDLVSTALGINQLNYSISGSSFAAGPQGNLPMVERCRELPTDQPVDVILLQGGSNDHVRDIPLGVLEERNAETFCGALNLILDHMQEAFPHAKIVCFTPWLSDGSANGIGLTAEDYTSAMVSLCQSRNIFCYNASLAEENGMHLNDEGFRSRFCLSSTDRYHLNDTGHRRFAAVMAPWLSQTLAGGHPVQRFADLQIASDDLRLGVSRAISTGLMTADGELFAPTRCATRQVLAQALYSLANQPLSTEFNLPDVPREAEGYSAICYVIDAGLLSGPEGFSPQQPLSREMLVTALYRCYTELYGGEATKLTGLGPYPDGAQVSEYAKTPIRWALACGLISEKDGTLRPQSTVSRGELAISLGMFVQLIGEIS